MSHPISGTAAAWRRLQGLAQALSRSTFVLSIALLAFANGFLVHETKWFPFSIVNNGLKTFLIIRNQLFPPFAQEQFLGFTGGNIGDVARNRLIVRAPAPDAANDEHFLMSGGLDQFLDYCPVDGCIAVELSRTGKLVHAYPYRPDQFETHQIAALPYEQVLFDFAKNMYPLGMVKLPGGDLIVTFHQWDTFPFGGGIARVRPDGSVAWFRHDYSHHWPRRLPDGDIVVPGMRLAGPWLSARLVPGVDMALDCDGKTEEDTVRVVTPDGRLKQEISVFDAFLRSPYRAMLKDPPNPCIPLHLNNVEPVTPGIVALYHDVSPDDFVISMRDVNAFAILGRHDHRVKHLVTGTFLRQHSVQPLGQSATMLMFDNHGADAHAGPSRFLAYDLADRTERTLLPNRDSHLSIMAMFSDIAGDISVSPDLSRALVAASMAGRAYEVRLSDGKILTEFNDVHDLHRVPAAAAARNRAAGRFALYTLEYVR